MFVCFFKQKTAYDMRISDWSSDVCSSDLQHGEIAALLRAAELGGKQIEEGVARQLAVVAATDIIRLHLCRIDIDLQRHLGLHEGRVAGEDERADQYGEQADGKADGGEPVEAHAPIGSMAALHPLAGVFGEPVVCLGDGGAGHQSYFSRYRCTIDRKSTRMNSSH